MWRRIGATLAIAITAGLLAPGAVAGPRGHAATANADPTLGPLISGSTSLVHGTHVWTDYAYDDRGTNAGSAGSYPAEANPGNAADLIQLQLTPTKRTLQIRAVLETLTDAKAPLLGVGIDTDANPATGASALPGGQWKVSGTPLGLDRLVLVSAPGAQVLSWNGTGWSNVGTAAAAVDPVTNTMTTTVATTLLGSAGPRWRVVGALGLAFADQRWTDGKGPIYDLAYVHDPSTTNFQSNLQASILSGKSDAAAAEPTIDVARLRTGGTALAAPTPAVKNTFLYRSALDLGEGIRSGNSKYAGPYQPYGVWFPAGLPARPPLILFLHGSGLDHLSGGPYGGGGAFVSAGPVSVGPGEISPRAVVITPLARLEMGTNSDGPAEQDILDALHDAELRFDVDLDRVVLSGYSLGGVGSFRFAELYPDLWAGVIEIVGAPQLGAITTEEEAQGQQTLPNDLENLRNLRFRMAHSRLDELETAVSDQPDQAALHLEQLGYDFRYWQMYRRDHLTFPVSTVQCEMDAAIARGRLHDPAEITYSQDPAMVTRDAKTGMDLRHDHAYWMSDMVVRGTSFKPGDKGTVDVTNLARADRVPTVTSVLGTGENVTAGRDVCGPNPNVMTDDVWTVIGNAWSPGPAQPTSNALRMALTKVASFRLDLEQVRGLDLRHALVLHVTSDGPATLHLAGRWTNQMSIEQPGQPTTTACARGGELTVALTAGTNDVRIVPAAGRCTAARTARPARTSTRPAGVKAPLGSLAATGASAWAPAVGLVLLVSALAAWGRTPERRSDISDTAR